MKHSMYNLHIIHIFFLMQNNTCITIFTGEFLDEVMLNVLVQVISSLRYDAKQFNDWILVRY